MYTRIKMTSFLDTYRLVLSLIFMKKFLGAHIDNSFTIKRPNILPCLYLWELISSLVSVIPFHSRAKNRTIISIFASLLVCSLRQLPKVIETVKSHFWTESFNEINFKIFFFSNRTWFMFSCRVSITRKCSLLIVTFSLLVHSDDNPIFSDLNNVLSMLLFSMLFLLKWIEVWR